MQIYIIAQYLSLQPLEKSRLYRLGKAYAEAGHEVTVMTMAAGLNLELKKKSTGLVQRAGLGIIGFNVRYRSDMAPWRKLIAYWRFARMAREQLLQLPKPDLLIGESPPLTVGLALIPLQEQFKAPLVVEINELWPDAPLQRKSLPHLGLKKGLQLKKRLYSAADRLVAVNRGIYDALQAEEDVKEKARLVADSGDEQHLMRQYEQALAGLIK